MSRCALLLSCNAGVDPASRLLIYLEGGRGMGERTYVTGRIPKKKATEKQLAVGQAAKAKATKRKERFIEAYIRLGEISKAAAEIKINRTTHYRWLEEDAEYAVRFHGAEQAVADREQNDFLMAYIENDMSVTKAIEQTGKGSMWHYDRLKNDPLYAEKYDTARMVMADKVEQEAFRRAVTGRMEPIYDKQGNRVDERVVFSDQILIQMLKGMKKEYKEKSGDVNVKVEIDAAEALRMARERVIKEMGDGEGNGSTS